jgi:hypothetical protein
MGKLENSCVAVKAAMQMKQMQGVFYGKNYWH